MGQKASSPFCSPAGDEGRASPSHHVFLPPGQKEDSFSSKSVLAAFAGWGSEWWTLSGLWVGKAGSPQTLATLKPQVTPQSGMVPCHPPTLLLRPQAYLLLPCHCHYLSLPIKIFLFSNHLQNGSWSHILRILTLLSETKQIRSPPFILPFL